MPAPHSTVSNTKKSREHFLVRSWYQSSRWLLLLTPISAIYALLTSLRRKLYQLGWLDSFRAPVPVIVVGNITVGGTGKTPLVIALVESLRQAGFKPGVISRGYGSHAPHYPYNVTTDSPVEHSGDEPLLIVLRSQVPLVIASNRQQAISALLAEHHCDVIISDDGLQHYAMQRDYEIVVVDGERGFGNQYLLPAGPLRESTARLKKVNHVVCNDGVVNLPVASINHSLMHLMPDNFISLTGKQSIAVTEWSGDKKVHAVAGIGNPQRFFNTLRKLGFDPIEHHFADHHDFSATDCQFNDNLAVIMTEKDAVKMRAFSSLNNCWYLPVSAHIEGELLSDLVSALHAINKEAP